MVLRRHARHADRWLAGALLILATLPAEAQAPTGDATYNDQSCALVQLQDLLDHPDQVARQGQGRAAVDVRLPSVSGVNVQIRDTVARNVSFRLNQASMSSALYQATTQRSPNIRFYGVVRPSGSTPPYLFTIMSYLERGTDAQMLGAEADAAHEARDVDRLLAIAARALGSPEYPAREVATQCRRWAYEIREQANPQDVQTLLELARLYYQLGDHENAIRLLAQAVAIDPENPAIDETATAIHAVWYGGRWHSEEQVRVAEGFVQGPNGEWTTQERLDFEAAVRTRGTEPGRRNPRNEITPDRRQQMVSQGIVDVGFNKEEAAGALGFPDRVDRMVVNDVIFEQWVYERRTVLYFDHMLSGNVVFLKQEQER